MIKCYDENMKTPRCFSTYSKHVTSEQKVLSSWNKIPTEDLITAISFNFVFKSKYVHSIVIKIDKDIKSDDFQLQLFWYYLYNNHVYIELEFLNLDF